MPAPGRVCTFKPCFNYKNAKDCVGSPCNGYDFFNAFCVNCDRTTRKVCVLRNAIGKDDACVIRVYYALYNENLALKAKVRKLQREARKARRS